MLDWILGLNDESRRPLARQLRSMERRLGRLEGKLDAIIQHFQVDYAPRSLDVILESCGNRKLQAVKAVREELGVSLMDAKALVESAPVTLLSTTLDDQDAAQLKRRLRRLGARCVLRRLNIASARSRARHNAGERYRFSLQERWRPRDGEAKLIA